MRSMHIENAGHIWGQPQIVRVLNITEPKFNYINQVALNSGMGRLSQALSYSQAVAAMEMKRGRNALAETDAQTRAAEMEAQYTDEGMQEAAQQGSQVLLQNKEETQRKISILDRQKSFFDGITTSNILSEYNEKMLQARQEDLENNPSGEGHMQRMAEAHDALVCEYLSGSFDPAIKSRLIPTFKESGARVANRAFDEEQTRIKATAELQLEDALERTTLHIANGMNPEEAIKELDPIMESIPNSMPGKEKMLKKARNELVEFSLVRTAQLNPWLAERNMQMEDSMYAELTPRQRLNIEAVIKAKKQDLGREAEARNQEALSYQIAAEDGPIWGKRDAIYRGEYQFADLEADKKTLNKTQYKFLLGNIAKYNEAQAIANAKQIAIASKHAQDGNYYNLSAKEQNAIILEAYQTQSFEYQGQRADNRNMNRAKADFMQDFNVAVPIFKRDLLVSMLEGTAEQAEDATLAFRKTYTFNRVVLGSNDSEIEAMLCFATLREKGVTVEKAQKVAREYLTPMSAEERESLDKSFKLDFPRNKGEMFSQECIRALKNHKIEFDKGDFIGPRTAEQLAYRYYLGTHGDKIKALDMMVAAINASYRPSTVNGPGTEDYRMWQAPEGLFAGKGYDDALIRKVFCNRAAQLAATSIGDEQGWLEILPIEDDKPNQCVYHTSTGAKLNGTFWFEHVPGTIGKYHVKYRYRAGLGYIGQRSGFLCTQRNSAGEQEAAIVDIDDLDWNFSLTPLLQGGK